MGAMIDECSCAVCRNAIQDFAAVMVQKAWRGYGVRALYVPMLYDDTCCERCGGWEDVLHTYCFYCTPDEQKDMDWRQPAYAIIGGRTLGLPLGFFRRRTDIVKLNRNKEVQQIVQRN